MNDKSMIRHYDTSGEQPVSDHTFTTMSVNATETSALPPANDNSLPQKDANPTEASSQILVGGALHGCLVQ